MVFPVGIIELQLYEFQLGMFIEYDFKFIGSRVEGEADVLEHAFLFLPNDEIPHIKIVKVLCPSFSQVVEQIEIEIPSACLLQRHFKLCLCFFFSTAVDPCQQ